MTRPDNQDWLDVTLTNIVRPMVGLRCKTKDTNDFPELAEEHTGGRCLVCTTYEEVDAAKKIIAIEMAEERIAELEQLHRTNGKDLPKRDYDNVTDEAICGRIDELVTILRGING